MSRKSDTINLGTGQFLLAECQVGDSGGKQRWEDEPQMNDKMGPALDRWHL